MNKATIKCEHCGAICNLEDGYCKNCWKKLSCEAEQDNFIIDGIGQSEWESFIGKKADRYIDVYKKNEGKKIFLHINWAAFFWGLNWMLYRRMFKFAVIGYIISAVLSIILSTILIIPHIEEMKVLNEDIAPYHAYLESGGKTFLLDSQGVPYSPEVVQQGAQAERELYKIETDVKLKSFFLIPLNWIFFGLFGDALYKMHILKNIKNKEGGTSVPSLLGGRLLFSAIEVFAFSPLISLIMNIGR